MLVAAEGGDAATLVTRWFVDSWFKAIRTGVVISIGGEFGIALLTLCCRARSMPRRSIGQPLLVAIVLSMVLSPFVISNNKRVARFLLRENGPPARPSSARRPSRTASREREHVILCGFGRVGQNVARVLESQGFEYIALDLDPARIRAARQAGDPGDLRRLGRRGDAACARASSKRQRRGHQFREPGHGDRHPAFHPRAARATCPVLVRTQDDAKLTELKEAGATDVVPETFEASLMLVSQVLLLLKVPVCERRARDQRHPHAAATRCCATSSPATGSTAHRARAGRRRGAEDRGASARRLGRRPHAR